MNTQLAEALRAAAGNKSLPIGEAWALLEQAADALAQQAARTSARTSAQGQPVHGQDWRERWPSTAGSHPDAKLPEKAAPVEPGAPCVVPESAVQELCTLLEREQGVYLTHTTISKYLSTVLKAAPKPLPLKELERLIYEHTKLNPNSADDRELIGYIVNAARAIEQAHGIGIKEQA